MTRGLHEVDDDFADYVRARQHQLLRAAYLVCGDEHLARGSAAGRAGQAWPFTGPRSRTSTPTPSCAGSSIAMPISAWRKRRRESRGRRRAICASLIRTCRGRRRARASASTSCGLSTQLPPRQRAVIVLRYFEDRTERDTADALGVSVGTVKSQAHDALRTGCANSSLTSPSRHLEVSDDSRSQAPAEGGGRAGRRARSRQHGVERCPTPAATQPVDRSGHRGCSGGSGGALPRSPNFRSAGPARVPFRRRARRCPRPCGTVASSRCSESGDRSGHTPRRLRICRGPRSLPGDTWLCRNVWDSTLASSCQSSVLKPRNTPERSAKRLVRAVSCCDTSEGGVVRSCALPPQRRSSALARDGRADADRCGRSSTRKATQQNRRRSTGDQ